MGNYRAAVSNRKNFHQVALHVNDANRSIDIPPRLGGSGSSITGGELLFLAIATCYCNDIYREANKRGITVHQVDVSVEGEFAGEGLPSGDIRYRARVQADAGEAAIQEMMRYVDEIAEVHNTIRRGTSVEMAAWETIQAES